MKVGRTLLNAFVFNLMLLLVCAPAIIHFQIEIFAEYMRLTSSVTLFTIALKNMPFFKFFWKNMIFLYLFLAWSVLTFLYLMCTAKSSRLNLKKIIETIKKERDEAMIIARKVKQIK